MSDNIGDLYSCVYSTFDSSAYFASQHEDISVTREVVQCLLH